MLPLKKVTSSLLAVLIKSDYVKVSTPHSWSVSMTIDLQFDSVSGITDDGLYGIEVDGSDAVVLG